MEEQCPDDLTPLEKLKWLSDKLAKKINVYIKSKGKADSMPDNVVLDMILAEKVNGFIKKIKKNEKNEKKKEKQKVKVKVLRKKAKHFKNGICYDWQYSQNFKEHVESYANKYAKIPDMSEAKQLNEKIMKEIELKLRNESLCSSLEFVGSVYEGLKVKGGQKKSDGLEFDIMVIWEPEDRIQIIPTELANYFLVKHAQDPNETSVVPKCRQFDRNSNLSPGLVANYFLGKIQNCINSLSCLEDDRLIDIKLRKHGPAIQMDVYRTMDSNTEDSSTVKLYSVDIVPSLKFNEEYYVAKELRYNILKDVSFDRHLTWRKSTSLNEKEKLKTIDAGNGNRRKLLRILKTFRNEEPSLQSLTSYHFKNILLRVNQNKVEESWDDQHLGERLMDLILETQTVLASKNLPSFFQPEINLLAGINDIALTNMENRFRKMYNSYYLMKKLLKVPKKEATLTEQSEDALVPSLTSTLPNVSKKNTTPIEQAKGTIGRWITPISLPNVPKKNTTPSKQTKVTKVPVPSTSHNPKNIKQFDDLPKWEPDQTDHDDLWSARDFLDPYEPDCTDSSFFRDYEESPAWELDHLDYNDYDDNW